MDERVVVVFAVPVVRSRVSGFGVRHDQSGGDLQSEHAGAGRERQPRHVRARRLCLAEELTDASIDQVPSVQAGTARNWPVAAVLCTHEDRGREHKRLRAGPVGKQLDFIGQVRCEPADERQPEQYAGKEAQEGKSQRITSPYMSPLVLEHGCELVGGEKAGRFLRNEYRWAPPPDRERGRRRIGQNA
ncbi:MAG: hypothetical protein WEF86_02030 [Gemmatimonadota bacterium]